MKNIPCQDGALQHRARNGAQRVARLAAQSGCALEAHKAEHGQHQRRPQRGERNALEPELIQIQMEAMTNQQDHQNNHDEADGNHLNP